MAFWKLTDPVALHWGRARSRAAQRWVTVIVEWPRLLRSRDWGGPVDGVLRSLKCAGSYRGHVDELLDRRWSRGEGDKDGGWARRPWWRRRKKHEEGQWPLDLWISTEGKMLRQSSLGFAGDRKRCLLWSFAVNEVSAPSEMMDTN